MSQENFPFNPNKFQFFFITKKDDYGEIVNEVVHWSKYSLQEFINSIDERIGTDWINREDHIRYWDPNEQQWINNSIEGIIQGGWIPRTEEEIES